MRILKSPFLLGIIFNLNAALAAPSVVVQAGCEFYIDRALVVSSPQGAQSVELFFKIGLREIQGTPVSVGFEGKHQDSRLAGGAGVILAKVYPGAEDQKDSWYIRFQNIVGRPQDDFSYIGAFFLKTDKNYEYWINADAQPYKNFILDRELAMNIMRLMGIEVYESDIKRAILTNRQFPYLNSRGCGL